MSASRTLLYFCPGPTGGIADYARFQIRALAALGVKVTLLTSKRWPHGSDASAEVLPLPDNPPLLSRLPAIRPFITGLRFLRNFRTLGSLVQKKRADRVLLSSYTEYLAPLWSPKFVKLARNGVTFGAIAHDPVRDYVVGPLWWHRWSIACGYSFLTHAFVHDDIELDTVRTMPALRTTVLPFGVYPFADPSQSREEARRKYHLPNHATVFLAFGLIRDGKNLDLLLRAIAEFPEVYLLVAGKPQSPKQRPIQFYQKLAADLGLAGRCRWICEYVPECEVGNLFLASDLAVFCYTRDFRSGSSALNVAVHYRKPCLASSGQGNLKSTVSRYQLGIWVEPDSVESLAGGIRQSRSALPIPRWEAYEAENSWERNAEILGSQMGLLK